MAVVNDVRFPIPNPALLAAVFLFTDSYKRGDQLALRVSDGVTSTIHRGTLVEQLDVEVHEFREPAIDQPAEPRG